MSFECSNTHSRVPQFDGSICTGYGEKINSMQFVFAEVIMEPVSCEVELSKSEAQTAYS